MESSNEPRPEPSDERRDERCTAPHPAKAFLMSLPAFALVVAAVVLIWLLL
jgi:hypothetical protein